MYINKEASLTRQVINIVVEIQQITFIRDYMDMVYTIVICI
ncbi:hypothetical protein [Paraclostridium bifermentans]|nr:hypothetical protein [Paraclostridium bifermentans]